MPNTTVWQAAAAEAKRDLATQDNLDDASFVLGGLLMTSGWVPSTLPQELQSGLTSAVVATPIAMFHGRSDKSVPASDAKEGVQRLRQLGFTDVRPPPPLPRLGWRAPACLPAAPWP